MKIFRDGQLIDVPDNYIPETVVTPGQTPKDVERQIDALIASAIAAIDADPTQAIDDTVQAELFGLMAQLKAALPFRRYVFMKSRVVATQFPEPLHPLAAAIVEILDNAINQS